MQKKFFYNLLFMALAMVLIQGCSSKNQKKHFRIGLNSWPGYEFLYLAKVKGFFKEEGLDIDIVEYASLSDTRKAYELGQIDILPTTAIDLFLIRQNTILKPQIFHIIDYSNGGDLILARNDLPNINALKGKRVGVEFGSLSPFILTRALQLNGLKLSDVEIVNTNQLSMKDFFLNNKVDALVTYPPFSLDIMQAGKAKSIFTTKEIPHEVIDLFAMDESVLKDNPEIVKSFLRAYNKAVEYSKNHEDGFEIMAKREGISVKDFKYILANEITMLSMHDQSSYFMTAGKLESILVNTDKVLRETKQLSIPVDVKSLYNVSK